MFADERGHPVELRASEAAALVEADGIKPELGEVLGALYVDVRRLGPPGHWNRRKTGKGLAGARSASRTMAPGVARRQCPRGDCRPSQGVGRPVNKVCRRLTRSRLFRNNRVPAAWPGLVCAPTPPNSGRRRRETCRHF